MPLGLSDALTLPVLSDGGDSSDGADSPQETKLHLRLCEIMICATEALNRVHSGGDSKKAAPLLACISLFDAQLTKAASQVHTAIGESNSFLTGVSHQCLTVEKTRFYLFSVFSPTSACLSFPHRSSVSQTRRLHLSLCSCMQPHQHRLPAAGKRGGYREEYAHIYSKNSYVGGLSNPKGFS